MYNRIRWASMVLLAVVLSGGLAGCIQPDATPTATFSEVPNNPLVATQPGAAPAPTENVVAAAPQVDTALITQLILLRGDTPANLQVWYDTPLGPDRIQGFSYTNQNSVLCAGFVLVAFTNGVRQPQNDNGAKGCALQPGQGALAGVTVIVTSDGQPYTIIMGRVSDSTISAVSVEFGDGTNTPFNPVNGGFMIVKPGVAQVLNITAIDAFGNTVLGTIPTVPVG